MNLIDKDALIEALGIETDCYDCEHERMKYHCDLDPVEACTKIIEAPVVTVTTESVEKAIEVLKNAAWLGAVYSFEETEEAVKTAIRALQVTSAQHNVHDFPKDADCISRADAIDAVKKNTFRLTFAEEQSCEGHVAWSAEAVYSDVMEGALLELPSAQPEIIRCTECKHYREYDSKYVKNAVVVQCMADRYPISETIPDGWFCAGAERRTDE